MTATERFLHYITFDTFSEEYEAWLARLDQFLWEERPDALYATAGPLTKQAEAESLLHPLWQMFGTYTIEMDTSAEPYPLSVQLQRIPGLHSQQQEGKQTGLHHHVDKPESLNGVLQTKAQVTACVAGCIGKLVANAKLRFSVGI